MKFNKQQHRTTHFAEKFYFLEKIEFGNDEEYLKKELYKIKNKYSKKYEGNELEYKVINYLYKKGFNLEDIKRCYDEDIL